MTQCFMGKSWVFLCINTESQFEIRCPLMAATAVWALWTTAEHVGSMARPTTDDNITVYDDAVFCDSETQKTCVWTRQALPVLGMLGRGTQ